MNLTWSETPKDRFSHDVAHIHFILHEKVIVLIPGSANGTPPNKVLSNSDYISRAQDHNNIVRFDRNEDNRYCSVTIIDDSLYEEEEKFKVILAEPMGGRLGDIVEAEVTIATDKNDGT